MSKDMLVAYYRDYRAIVAEYENRTLAAEEARAKLKDLNKRAKQDNLPFVADLSVIDQEEGIRELPVDSYEEDSSSEEEQEEAYLSSD